MKKQSISIFAVLLCLCFYMTGCASDSGQNAVDETVAGQITEAEVSEEESVSGEEAASAEVGENGQNDTENREVENQEVENQGAGNSLDTGSYPDGSTPQFSGVKLKLTVNGTDEVIIAMYDNTAVDALLERLPLTDLSFFDLSGEEKPIERLEEPISLEEEEPGYDPVVGEMTIYRPWGNFTIFYKDFRYSDELVPLGMVESGLDVIAGQTEDFTGVLELIETDN